MTALTLEEQRGKFIEMAEMQGLRSNFLFTSVLYRYDFQLENLSKLENEIRNFGKYITSDYNRALCEYNKCSNAANGTAMALMKIINQADRLYSSTNIQESDRNVNNLK